MAESAGEVVSGAVKELLESVKVNANERLRGPFGGALIAAWFVINWKTVVVLAFSDRKIEERVQQAGVALSDTASTIWWPLAIAAAGILAFYLLNSAFLAVHEVYGIGRRWIERRFDSYRWVHPDQYVGWKAKANDEMAHLRALASDNLAQLEAVKATLLSKSSALSELETTHAATVAQLEQLRSTNEISQGSLTSLTRQLKSLEKDYKVVKEAEAYWSERTTAAVDDAVKNAVDAERRRAFATFERLKDAWVRFIAANRPELSLKDAVDVKRAVEKGDIHFPMYLDSMDIASFKTLARMMSRMEKEASDALVESTAGRLIPAPLI